MIVRRWHIGAFRGSGSGGLDGGVLLPLVVLEQVIRQQRTIVVDTPGRRRHLDSLGALGLQHTTHPTRRLVFARALTTPTTHGSSVS
jgi:hypothetical protein